MILNLCKIIKMLFIGAVLDESVFFLVIMLLIPAPGFSQTPDQRLPWYMTEYTFLGENEVLSEAYKVIDNVVCHYDTHENLLCLDYGWRFACLEIYAVFFLNENSPYLFNETHIPVFEVKGFNKIDFNAVLHLNENFKNLMPWSYNENFLLWQVESGSIETLINSETGLVYHLFFGEEMSIQYKLQNGELKESNITLKGLPPLLLSVLEKAEAMKPEGQCPG